MKKLENSGFSVSDKALNGIKNIVKNKKREKNFGNGRMIDNLYNKLMIEHASVTYNEPDSAKLITISDEAVSNINMKAKKGGYFE